MYLLRVMRAGAREVRDVLGARSTTHGHLRDRLLAIAVVTVGIDAVCAVLALVLERSAKDTQITDFGSALFWTSTQLLTISSSLVNPISMGGRILDVAMEAYAVVVVASLAGALGAFMVSRGREHEHARAAQHGAERGPPAGTL